MKLMGSAETKVIIIGLFFGITTLASAWAANSAHPYACVLNFERKDAALTKTLNKKLSDMEGVEIVNEAVPSDILRCLDQGAVSVMIVGHAGDLDSKNQVAAPLVYFRELKGQERTAYLDKIQKQLDHEVAEFKEKVRTNKLKSVEGSYYYKILEMDQKLKKIPATQAIYENPKLVENQIWKRVLSNPENLRKLSIVSCLPEKVADYYPELNDLKTSGVDVEFAPISRFLSFFMSKNVVTPDFDWMRKTLNESRPEFDARVSDREVKTVSPDPLKTDEVKGAFAGSAR